VKFKTTGTLYKRIKRNITASPFLHVAAMGSIVFALVIVGIFSLLFVNINEAIKVWEKNIRLVAYLKDRVSPEDVENLRESLSDLKAVASVHFIPKQEAWKDLKKLLEHRASLLDGLSQNPLPDSFEITLTPSQENWNRLTSLSKKISDFPGVDQVEYGKAWVHRLLGFIAFFRLAAVVIGVFVLASSAFVCANTIKLTIFARRDAFEIMKLIGATDAFVKRPFYIQNLLEGLVGAGVAIGLLFGVYRFFVGRIQQEVMMLSGFQISFLPVSGMLAMLSTGMILGWIGSYFSLRKFLSS
jgi:cell division transport system permease protein